MKSWRKALSATLAVYLVATAAPSLAATPMPSRGDTLGKAFTGAWLGKKCEGFSAEVQSVQAKGQEQRGIPNFLRAKPGLGDVIEARVKFTNDSYKNDPNDSTSKSNLAYLVEDPLVMKNGQGFTVIPKPVLEWSNSDENKKFILDHGDSVTVVYKHIVTEDDLSKRNLPEGPNYPISNSGSAVPDCTVSPGVIYGWSSLAAVAPGLVDFFQVDRFVL